MRTFRKILVTGSTGFVGSHMVDFLLANHPETEVWCTRRYHLSRTDKVLHFAGRVKWFDVNLNDPAAVNELIKNIQPDLVFHFAAESFVSPSWRHPKLYMDVNYGGTLNILNALRDFCAEAVIHIPGSGEEYGDIAFNDLPINLKTVLNPVNPYAVSKVAQDLIASVYHESYGLKVIRTRAFNHEGPRREYVFGLSWYAFQIARIEMGATSDRTLKVGYLGDERNFTHVSDMVRAYWLSVKHCDFGKLYLVGNDDESSVFTFEEGLRRLIGMSSESEALTWNVDDKYVRPTAVPYLVADVTEFRQATGWVPVIGFNEILSDTLNYWRDSLRRIPDLAKLDAL